MGLIDLEMEPVLTAAMGQLQPVAISHCSLYSHAKAVIEAAPKSIRTRSSCELRRLLQPTHI
jgi:hypothetical protein